MGYKSYYSAGSFASKDSLSLVGFNMHIIVEITILS